MLIDFLKEEMSDHQVRNILLESIEQAIRTGKYQDELIFNRYSLRLFYDTGHVRIHDYVDTDAGTVTIQTNEFVSVLTDYRTT